MLLKSQLLFVICRKTKRKLPQSFLLLFPVKQIKIILHLFFPPGDKMGGVDITLACFHICCDEILLYVPTNGCSWRVRGVFLSSAL